jgi:hypothetical protein
VQLAVLVVEQPGVLAVIVAATQSGVEVLVAMDSLAEKA